MPAATPRSVSTVCAKCDYIVKPEVMKYAVQSRVDREDGTFSLQYDHPDGECPPERIDFLNAGSRQTLQGA